MNRILLSGYIYKKPFENNTKGGEAYLTGSIAVKAGFKDPNGRKHTDFVPFKAFGFQAEYLNKYWNPASRVEIVGDLRVIEGQGEGGKKGKTMYVRATEITIMKPDGEKDNAFADQTEVELAMSVQSPVNSTPAAIQDDDLPF